MKPLEWGKRRGYPALLFGLYGIGPGEECWKIFWSIAKPQAKAEAEVAMAEIEKQEQADISQKGA